MTQLPEWYPRAVAKLNSLQSGTDAQSFQAAQLLLTALAQAGSKPSRIVHTAEDTIALWFHLAPLKIRVEACDDGAYVLSVLGSELLTRHVEYQTADDVVGWVRDAELGFGRPGWLQ